MLFSCYTNVQYTWRSFQQLVPTVITSKPEPVLTHRYQSLIQVGGLLVGINAFVLCLLSILKS